LGTQGKLKKSYQEGKGSSETIQEIAEK